MVGSRSSPGSLSRVNKWCSHTDPLNALGCTFGFLTPDAPTILQANRYDKKITIKFEPPKHNGNGPVTNYHYSLDNGVTFFSVKPASLFSPITIGGLTNGQTYQVALCAVNSIGAGTISNVVPFVSTIPDAPIFLHTDIQGASQTIYITPPENTGGLKIDYQYTTQPNGRFIPCTLDPAKNSFTIPFASVEYFVLRAVNAVGPSMECPVVNIFTTWSRNPAGSPIRSLAVDSSDNIYVGTDSGNLYQYSTNNPLTFISDNQYKNNTTLTSFTIPSEITSIGGDAFTNCTSLLNVTISNTFLSNNGYTSYHAGDTITSSDANYTHCYGFASTM